MISTVEEKLRQYSVDALKRYWPKNIAAISELPISKVRLFEKESLPPKLKFVKLPDWASDIGVEGQLLVPIHLIEDSKNPVWQHTDWLNVVFWYLNGLAEREYERMYKPVHSYSYRLKDWDSRIWSHAWVNRIALFLRRWAAYKQGANEAHLLGSLPSSEIIITYDLDAIDKSLQLRFKQSGFHIFNALRSLLQGEFNKSALKFFEAVKFLFITGNYWCFNEIMKTRKIYDNRSIINVYGKRISEDWKDRLKQYLFDPTYDIKVPKLFEQFKKMQTDGWTIGLHPSYNSWKNTESIKEERELLERIIGVPVIACRQHWLRYSWEHTWKAQQDAGLKLDTTLGFNDRPSFRNGCVLEFNPWDIENNMEMKLKAIPMVLMDSHLYDYASYTDEQRDQELDYWLSETKQVHGVATILWHVHTLSSDYGWSHGYKKLISKLEQ